MWHVSCCCVPITCSFTFVRINFINLQRVVVVPGMMGPKLDLMIVIVIVLPELWWCLLGTCWDELLFSSMIVLAQL